MRSTRATAMALSTTLVAGVLVVGTTLMMPADAADTASPVQVTVNTRAGLSTVDSAAIGVNHAVWDSQLGTDDVADLMDAAGVGLMRYPGGSYADIYHWRDNTAPGGYVAPDTDFDHFMAGVQRAGAQAMVIANYGTGTAEEAAEWVRYANVTKGYGVKYWEIGNELYGNGHYGAAWEADNHPDKSPAQYATLVRDYAQAMKAVDPSVKIGAVLTMAGNWPDGIVAGGDAGTWNQVVLSMAGPYIDFAILHWYPGGSNGPEALTRLGQATDAVWLVRQQIARYAGSRSLGLAVTEINTGYGMNTQPGALFAADAYASLLDQGIFTVDWWNVHNGPTAGSSVGGQPDFADFGLLSSGTCLADGVTCEPPANTPFAPYHAITMTSLFVRPGDQLIRAGSSDPLVRAHAARRPNGDLAVLLVNQDPTNARPVSLRYAGYSPTSTAQVYTFVDGATAITSTSGPASTVTLPAYSLTTLVLHPSGPVAGPAAPGQPTASAVTATSATIAWPAGPGGVKYELHRQNGTTSEQWGETTGTSFTVYNLVPGTRYTANVIARDGAGRVSWASPPITFQTGTPSTSECAVTFTNATDWGNGYVASVDITNTSANPVDSWTLSFTWPTSWQQMSGGWNGNWSETGSTVRVSNVDWNRTIAAGATANVGFVGAYQGPNVQPPVFTLNGKLCTTR